MKPSQEKEGDKRTPQTNTITEYQNAIYHHILYNNEELLRLEEVSMSWSHKNHIVLPKIMPRYCKYSGILLSNECLIIWTYCHH